MDRSLTVAGATGAVKSKGGRLGAAGGFAPPRRSWPTTTAANQHQPSSRLDTATQAVQAGPADRHPGATSSTLAIRHGWRGLAQLIRAQTTW